MNKQAFADIESINVRVEERRLGVAGHGNWRVHEFSGLDAIPAQLRGAFDRGAAPKAHVVPLEAKVREVYQRRGTTCLLEDSYQVPDGSASDSMATVLRTITISLAYRRPARLALPRAA
jgi:hypothetical protein